MINSPPCPRCWSQARNAVAGSGRCSKTSLKMIVSKRCLGPTASGKNPSMTVKFFARAKSAFSLSGSRPVIIAPRRVAAARNRPLEQPTSRTVLPNNGTIFSARSSRTSKFRRRRVSRPSTPVPAPAGRVESSSLQSGQRHNHVLRGRISRPQIMHVGGWPGPIAIHSTRMYGVARNGPNNRNCRKDRRHLEAYPMAMESGIPGTWPAVISERPILPRKGQQMAAQPPLVAIDAALVSLMA